MRGWRSKFIFILIVYFAGFATAIYILAPTPEGYSKEPGGKRLFGTNIKTEQIVASVNSGMHKAVEMGKDAACKAAKFIKDKINEEQPQSNG
ncbi:MAG: hypothetical protein JW720_06465 [Sedimentisphaerales bacterium]|nr:hypothetical protein [Sedimentisphaerales bacterium]